ncbi:Small-conductance mechanosensitive channel [hydrothermal vent metagenome]|uniref:Small-conductance mechanosensitive channel n=1 Tax=hydrothermal vent metagenome TaxID=652676 RepID=A0A3B0QTD2_9ZZZZ
MLEQIFKGPSKEYIVVCVVFVVVAVILLVARAIALRVFRRWAEKTETTADDIVVHSLSYPSIFWAIAVALYIALGTSTFPVKYVDYGMKAIYVLIIFSVTLAIGNFTSRILQRYIEKTSGQAAATGLSKAILKGIVLAIGFIIIFNSLGISITPLVTALGVGGLAVALAFQDTLSNLFAGVHILVEKPLRVGDYIKLDGGEEGYVVDVGWRTTKIRKLQNNIVIIPNSKLSQSIITNYCMPDKRMSLLIPVGVSYDCDPQEIEDMLTELVTEAAGELKGLLSEPAPFVRFSPGFGESSLDFTIICQVGEFVQQYYVQHELRKRIFKRFKEEGVDIPFPIRTIHMKKT